LSEPRRAGPIRVALFVAVAAAAALLGEWALAALAAVVAATVFVIDRRIGSSG